VVGETVEAGLGLLGNFAAERFAQLAVFVEDTEIPTAVLELVWGLDARETRRVVESFADLSLVQEYRADRNTVRLHNIIRAYLRHRVPSTRLMEWHGRLLDAAAELCASRWWQLPERYDYLLAHLAEHLAGASRHSELDATVIDPRWLERRLDQGGPAALEADLARSRSPVADALIRAIRQNAHLLAPLISAQTLGGVLAARLAVVPGFQTAGYVAYLPRPHLTERWPLPNLPHPALLRSLAGHKFGVNQLVAALDDSWLAAVDGNGRVSIWDPVTGACQHQFDFGDDSIDRLTVIDHGRRLAASGSGSVRILDPVDGRLLHAFGHPAAPFERAWTMGLSAAVPTRRAGAGHR